MKLTATTPVACASCASDGYGGQNVGTEKATCANCGLPINRYVPDADTPKTWRRHWHEPGTWYHADDEDRCPLYAEPQLVKENA